MPFVQSHVKNRSYIQAKEELLKSDWFQAPEEAKICAKAARD